MKGRQNRRERARAKKLHNNLSLTARFSMPWNFFSSLLRATSFISSNVLKTQSNWDVRKKVEGLVAWVLHPSSLNLFSVFCYMSVVYKDSKKRWTLGCMILPHGFISPRSASSENLGPILLTIITHLGPSVAWSHLLPWVYVLTT